jgi:exodeoxyribonuclease V alpha subunit
MTTASSLDRCTVRRQNNSVVHVRQIVQVKTRRAAGFASVDLINKDGTVRSRDKSTVVKFPEDAVAAAAPGTLWEISGNEGLNQFVVNEYLVSEYLIRAEKVKFLRPSGRILARWISSNVKGVGSVIANRLVRLKNLGALVEERNCAALLEVAGMSRERVQRLFEQWPSASLYKTTEWLEEQQLPLGLGDDLVAIFGAEAIGKVSAHPFLLMAMGVSFDKTMGVAHSLKLSISDDCVMAGVALHVAINHSRSTRSTLINAEALKLGCSEVMKSAAPENIGDVAVEHGLMVRVSHGYQVFGKALMEAAVARFLVGAHKRERGEGALLAAWEIRLTRQGALDVLSKYESTILFPLTDEQREAVVGAVMNPVSCISGGAGTGKTTILRAILGVYDAIADGIACYQVALSGRAAQRMAESTSRNAQTIAKLIAEHLGENQPHLPDHMLLVIDEASMVDLMSMYKLIGMLPQATRVLFVGDTSQLPPVGDGLVFHALSDTQIPFFNLSQVKRQGEGSGIHKFATSIRERMLKLPPRTGKSLACSSDCSIDPSGTIERLVGLWREAGGIGNIVLSPIKRGEFGVKNINAKLQQAEGLDRASLHYNDAQHGWIPWITATGAKLLQGDPVLVIANNYDENADVRNGDLGLIVEVFERATSTGAIGVIEVNGSAIFVTPKILNKLDLGYAVTIHKSQGSQWPTCFVMLPIEASQMIDQTLIYTAVTRPSQRLVLIGDERVLEEAVRRGSLALKRQTCLSERILAG